jgi:hypothetical protein
MAKTEDSSNEREEDEMLPDEQEVIAERIDSLASDERLSVSDVAEELDIELDE